MTTATMSTINGIDTNSLKKLVADVAANSKDGVARFEVTTAWKGGTRSETSVDAWSLGGKRMKKDFTIETDEPVELCGANTHANPQEYLMAAFNACMMVGYVAGASMHGITLESLEIQTEGELDLRGLFGLDAKIKPGYDELRYTVRIKGDGTSEQFRQIHETVMKTSPNRWNIANPIRLESDLVIE